MQHRRTERIDHPAMFERSHYILMMIICALGAVAFTPSTDHPITFAVHSVYSAHCVALVSIVIIEAAYAKTHFSAFREIAHLFAFIITAGSLIAVSRDPTVPLHYVIVDCLTASGCALWLACISPRNI